MPTANPRQHRLLEINVTDAELEGALDSLAEEEQELRPLLEARATMTRGINEQIKEVRERWAEAQLKAMVEEREGQLLETHKRKLFDGFVFRLGDAYVIEVKEVVTMEKVEHGVGYKLRKPMLVSAFDDAEDDEDE